MRASRPLTVVALSPLLATASLARGDVLLEVRNAEAAAAVGAPVSLVIDLDGFQSLRPHSGLLLVTEVGTADAHPEQQRLSAQFVPNRPGSSRGTLWWLLPEGDADRHRFSLSTIDGDAAPTMTVAPDPSKRFYDLAELREPILRYNHGTVPVPEGIPPKYARGDYIQPLFGLHGEVLTEDYPKDHPHHRGLGWSWPVTRWKDEVRDLWAVVGVWSRPVSMRRLDGGPVLALLEAENVWKWGDQEEIVREEVVICAFRKTSHGRFVDIEVRLTALQDGVAIGGRPHGAYGGFGLRAAPVEEQKITAHVDDEDVKPRRSWLDYSGRFAGRKGLSGLAIFEHPTNPGYPNKLLTYPNLNYAMPAFPGDREVPLSKNKPLVLKHRLWVHDGPADEARLAAAWAAYANPPKVTVAKR